MVQPKEFDPSGEGNITKDIQPQIKRSIVCDGNQQQKYIACRNHPRIVKMQVVVCSIEKTQI